MWRDTALTARLGLDVPIVQGPFGSGLSAVDLVVAVSDAGGLGSFGVHHLPGPEIIGVADSIRARTSRPFALNLWIPMEGSEDPALTDDEFESATAALGPYFEELGLALPRRPERFTPRYAEQVEAALEARPAVLSFVFGVPDQQVLRRCRDAGIATIGTATTVDEAIELERAGVDAIVGSGFEAGGHRISFLRPAEDSLMGTMALIPQMADSVHIPVIAAGGIADGRGIAAALHLGAQAVQIGTAFLACRESGASQLHREWLRSTHARHTALTRAFTGRLARAIHNRFIAEMRNAEHQVPPYPVQAWLTGQFRNAATKQGRAELLPLWSGQSASQIRHDNAGDLMQALVADTSRLWGRVSHTP
jgi:nitronate monooxygenase